ncbi:MAG: CBS domain-containing protein [Planctomycetota bacterium]
MQVASLMQKRVRTCRVEDRLDRAAREMWEGDVGVVPVIDRDERLVGMLTDRDICMAAYTQGRSLAEIPVATAMAKNLVTCQADDLVADAEWRMQQNQIRRLPVVDARGRIVGILSINDLARRADAERTKSTRAVRTEEVAVTLAAISQPHGSVVEPVKTVAPPPPPARSSPPAARSSKPGKGGGRSKSAGA